MAFRLRTIEHTADGREVVRDHDIAAASLSIGRNAENAIALADLAVDPVHAVLEDLGGGQLRAQASGSLGFGLDGKTVHEARIDARTGAELRFGGFLLAVSLDGDGTPLVTIRQAAEAEGADEKSGFSLAGLMPGKRWMSWALAAVVLLAFLIVPVASNLTRGPTKAEREATGVTLAAGRPAVMGDRAWSSGKLSLAHHSLEKNCATCHVKPFEPVQDTTCMTCHEGIHDHAKPERLANARGPMGLGDQVLWSVAHTFGKPGPGACSDCHTEHEGAGKMEPTSQQFCADCHTSLDQRLTDTTLGNASDFGKLHPQFRPAIPTELGSAKLTRVSLDANPREASGLLFPHKLHVDPKGGVAKMAGTIGTERGYGSNGLQCADCHRKTADGVRFQPIEMEQDCGACHSLAYDRVGGIVRKLRHGDVDQMIADLSATAIGATPIVSGRRRPGDYADGGAYYASFRPAVGGSALAMRALSRDGICGECHIPNLSGGRFGVMPVTLVSRFMGHGWFDHDDHKQEKCTSCHVADKSSNSTDLLLPDLKSCRTCHEGESATKAEVPSSCAMCHSYHLTAQAPRAAKPKKL